MANGILSQLQQGLLGTPPSVEQIPTATPQQQQSQEQMLQTALPQLQQMLQQQPGSGFQPIAQQRRQEFFEETLPTIQEKFTSLTGGGQTSGAAGLTGMRAGEKLESDLSSLQAQMGQQERGQQMQGLQSLLQMGMQPQFEMQQIPGQPGFAQEFLGQAGQLAGQPLQLAQLLSMLFGKEFPQLGIQQPRQ